MLIEDIELQLNALGAEILTLHPELCLESWSHSLGEATEFDGWTAGFVLRGLKYELELAVDLMHIHSQPRAARIIAEWLLPPEGMGFVWVDLHGNKPFEDCRQSVLRAVARGSPEACSCGVTLLEVKRQFPEPLVKSNLTPDERAVYDCWLEHHRTVTPVPPHLSRQTDGFGLYPRSEEARARLARLLGTSPEVVSAVFPEAVVPPELLGSSVVIVDLAWQLKDFRLWRQLYREKPLCSGLIYLSPIGFAENRAAMLVVKFSGTNMHEMIGDNAVETGMCLCVFRFNKVTGRWTLTESQPINWKTISRTIYAGPLFLATESWAELTQIELSGEFFQPTLDLRWKLQDGGEQKLKVVPGIGQSEPEKLYVQLIAPGSVVEAVQKHFSFEPPGQ